MILDSFVELLESFLYLEYMEFWFFPLLGMAFLATVPVIIKRLFRWG